MSSSIIALKCPNCGNSNNTVERDVHYGMEFQCKYCDTRSVLIVDRQLVKSSELIRTGEKVCPLCGMVAIREARYCQNGHTLVKGCKKCDKEIAINHSVCDYCGYPTDAKDLTLRLLKEINEEVSYKNTDLIMSLLRGEGSQIIGSHFNEDYLNDVINNVSRLYQNNIGRQYIPVLVKIVEIHPPLRNILITRLAHCNNHFELLAELGDIDTIVNFAKKTRNPQYITALEQLGPQAIPALKSLTGLFAGEMGKSASQAIKRLKRR